jgi:hypothetical protein
MFATQNQSKGNGYGGQMHSTANFISKENNMNLIDKADKVETIQDAIELYADASEEEKICKAIKSAMRSYIEYHLKEHNVDKMELEGATVGLTQPSTKEVFDEEKWFDYIKKNLNVAKMESELQKLRSQFTKAVENKQKIYIRLKRG